jgi:hypothetical protein
MRPIRCIAVFLLFAIAFCGCKKWAIDVNPELEGKWHKSFGSSSDVSIYISNKGKSAVSYSYPGEKMNNTGGPAKLENDILYIGKFKGHIDLYPTNDSLGNKIIKIQGLTYYKF